MTGHKVLIIEDEPQRIQLIRAAFEQSGRGLFLEFVPSPERAVDVLAREPVDVLFFSNNARHRAGRDFVLEIKADRKHDIPLIMIVSSVDEKLALDAIRSGMEGCVLDGPENFTTYPAAAERAIARRDATREQAVRFHNTMNAELRRLKERLYHADKLACIGKLVSGAAHEINNPLTGTIAYAELLSMKVADQSVKHDLMKILESAERCKKIVDNLLTFSRERAPSRSLESVNDIIDRTIDLRSYSLRSSNIELLKDYAPVSTVFADAQQLRQLILNILLNAEQAIADSKPSPGKIIFTTRHDKERRMVVVRIADNGPGVPVSILPRIFDPFFTTRPDGAGTGLGLSIAREIVLEHGGVIRVENAKEGGAVFTIELPTGAAGKNPG